MAIAAVDVGLLADLDGNRVALEDLVSGKVDVLCVCCLPPPEPQLSPSKPKKKKKTRKARSPKKRPTPRLAAVGKAYATRDECVLEYQNLLKSKGYSMGSWSHAKGCGGMCGRTCRGTLRRDGTVFKYPQYLKLLFDAGLVRTRFDLFKSDTSARAEAFYKATALARARRSKKWNLLGIERQRSLALKLHRDLAHGLDDFVKLAPPFKPCVGSPSSPSLAVPDKVDLTLYQGHPNMQ